MAIIESGIINPVIPSVTHIDSYFRAYVRAFDYQRPAIEEEPNYENGYETRLETARAVAMAQDDCIWTRRIFGYNSRISLVTHWGDDETTAHHRAREIYTLDKTLAYYAGQTVVRLIGCTPADVTASALRAKDVTLEFARILGEAVGSDKSPDTPRIGIAHGLDVLEDAKQPAEYPDVNFARFAASIPVEPVRQIVARRSRKVAAKSKLQSGAAERGMGFLPARSGLVSLHPNVGLHRKTKQERVESLLFGDEAAEELVKGLVIRDRGLYESYKANLDDEGKLFDAIRPFPDLSFLSSRRASQTPIARLAEAQSIDELLAQNEALIQGLRTD